MIGLAERDEGIRSGQVVNPENERLVPHLDVVRQARVQGDPDRHLDHHGKAGVEHGCGGVDSLFLVHPHGLLLEPDLVVGMQPLDLLDLRLQLAHPLLHADHVDLPFARQRVKHGPHDDHQDDDGHSVVRNNLVKAVQQPHHQARQPTEGARSVLHAQDFGESEPDIVRVALPQERFLVVRPHVARLCRLPRAARRHRRPQNQTRRHARVRLVLAIQIQGLCLHDVVWCLAVCLAQRNREKGKVLVAGAVPPEVVTGLPLVFGQRLFV